MTIIDRFKELEAGKTQYLTRGEEASLLTLPQIFPKEGMKDNALPTPEQSVGGFGVSVLTSKLQLAMYSPSTPSTKFEVDELRQFKNNQQIDKLNVLFESGGLSQEESSKLKIQLGNLKKTQGDIKNTTSRIEKQFKLIMDTSGIKNKIAYGLQHFLITGSFALYIKKDYTSRLYSLRDFVSVRDRQGLLVEAIGRDSVKYNQALLDSLPEDKKEILSDEKYSEMDDVTLYTKSELISKGKYKVTEYVEDIEVKSWTQPKNPLIVPFTDKETGRTYNYGLVNSIIGDLYALENLSRNIKELAQAAAFTVFFVDENSRFDHVALNKAKNLDFLPGTNIDKNIKPLTLDKGRDLQIAFQQAGVLEKRISQFFLMNNSFQKESGQGEAEWRALISDIDSSLGNLYSVLAEEIQLPVSELVLYYMKANNELDGVIDDDISIKVITGVDALGRQTTKQQIMSSVGLIAQLGLIDHLEGSEIIKRIFAADGIEVDGLVKTDEKYAAEQAARQKAEQQAQLQQQAVAPTINAASKQQTNEES